MMRPWLLSALLLIGACFVSAQGVSYLIVKDEAQYSKAADFTNTYEFNVITSAKEKAGKCQAVRIHKNWYVTAAHCVIPRCDDNNCKLRMRLIVSDHYEMYQEVLHTKKQPRIFIHDKHNKAHANPSYDIALLYFPPVYSSYFYAIPSRKRLISEELFLRIMPDKALYARAINGTNIPQILSISSGAPAMLDRKISVISIWDGKRSLLKSQNPVFYSPKHKFLYMENFGIIKGLSGSGVMANTGEVVGIVSSTADIIVTRGAKKITFPVLFIAPFNDDIISFIKQHVESVDYKKAPKSSFKPIPQKYRPLAEGFDRKLF